MVRFLVAVGGVQLAGHAIGVEHPRQLAAAVHAQVKRIQGAQPAAIEHCRPAAAKVMLALFEQAGRHVGLGTVGPHQHQRNDAAFRGDRIERRVGAKRGVGESKRLPAVACQDQPTVIEVELCEDELLE